MTSLFSHRAFSTSPVTTDMISAMLSFADVREPMGAGRTRLRITRERIAKADVLQIVGDGAGRLMDLEVVWSEREGQVLRVQDDAALRARRHEAWEDFFDLEDEHRLHA
jgi:hypothetical protein